MNKIDTANVSARCVAATRLSAMLAYGRAVILITLAFSGFSVLQTLAPEPGKASRTELIVQFIKGTEIYDSTKFGGPGFPSEEKLKNARRVFRKTRKVVIPLSLVPRSGPEASKNWITTQSANASSPSEYDLSSATPFLPFVGNQTVVCGAVLSADGTNLLAAGLRRLSDCGLALDIVQSGAATPSASVVTSLPGAHDYLHQLAGLTTKANVFPQGCADPVFGLVSINTASPVGQTTNLSLVANLSFANDFLEVSIADSSANTFSTKTLTTNAVTSFYVADLNGDGYNDIVANVNPNTSGTQPASMAVFISKGDGTFQPAAYYAVPAGGVFFTVDDFNGDGRPDLVIGNFLSGGIATLLGNGDGTFKPYVTSAPAIMAGGPWLATGDINGDGKKDLISLGTVLFGAGDGTFSVGPTIPNNLLPPSFAHFAAADLNHDAKLDLICSADGYVQILFGNGDGTFQSGPAYASVPTGQPVTVTDIDGDGNADIVVGNSSQGLYIQDSNNPLLPMIQVLMGRGDGTFVGAPIVGGGVPNANQTSAPQVALADFMGIGRLQTLVIQATNTSNGTKIFLAVIPIDDAGQGGTAIITAPKMRPTMVVAADMNGDGKPDVVTAGFRGGFFIPTVAVLFNKGSGALAAEQDYDLPNQPINIAVGDFNGDGRMDIAAAVAPLPGFTGVSGVYVLFGQTNGTFAAPVQVDASVNPAALAVGDLNGDGFADLVIGDQGTFAHGQRTAGLLHIYLGAATGTLTPIAAPTTTAAFYTAVALGDLNKDGKLDLIAAGAAGTTLGALTPNLYVLHGNGDGTFQAAKIEPLAGTDGIGATSLVLADFNGDGMPDMAVGNPNDFTEIILSQGNGNYIHTLMALAQQPESLAAAPLISNQFADLVVSKTGVGTAIFRNVGNAAAWNASATSLSLSLLGAGQKPLAGEYQFVLTWPTNAAGFTLESTTNLGPSAVWLPASSLPVVVNGQNTVTNATSGAQRFFRLLLP